MENTYKSVDLANSLFVGYTFKRLEKREAILSEVIADPESLDIEVQEAAAQRREVRACKQVFVEFDVDDAGACVADILEVITGQPIERLQKNTQGGLLAQDIVQRTSELSKKTVSGTKKSVNSFATWLANRTQIEGGK